MIEHILAMIRARKDRNDLKKRLETIEKAYEQHLLEHDDLNFKALELIDRVEKKLSGLKGGRPKKEPESESNISKNILLTPDGNDIAKA
jgi:hypothetical protein